MLIFQRHCGIVILPYCIKTFSIVIMRWFSTSLLCSTEQRWKYICTSQKYQPCDTLRYCKHGCDINETVTQDKAVETFNPCHPLCLRYNFLCSLRFKFDCVICRVTLCFFEMDESELRRKPTGFSKWTSFSSYECKHLHGCSYLFIEKPERN